MTPSIATPRPRTFGRPLVLGAATLLLGTLSACANLGETTRSLSTLGGLVQPYKIDIQQGNVITREQVELLKPGLSRLQVRDLLGTPLLTSVFHASRWDYVFTFNRQGEDYQQRRLVIFFEGDSLARFEADEMPTEAEFITSLDTREAPDEAPVLQASEEAIATFRERYPLPETGAAAAAAPARSTYPPLEAPAPAR